MAISIAEAKTLKPGTLIQFGGPNLYEVVSVLEAGDGVHITLRRDDGYASFATHHDLVQANLRGVADGSPAAVPEPVAVEVVEPPADDAVAVDVADTEPDAATDTADDTDAPTAPVRKGRKA